MTRLIGIRPCSEPHLVSASLAGFLGEALSLSWEWRTVEAGWEDPHPLLGLRQEKQSEERADSCSGDSNKAGKTTASV